MFCQCFDLSKTFISPISSSLDKRERKTSLWRILCDTRLKIMFCWCSFFSIDYLIICFHRRHIVWNIPWRKSIKGNLGWTSSCRANGCGGLPSWEHQTKQGHFCLFVDEAPTLIIDNFTTCIVGDTLWQVDGKSHLRSFLTKGAILPSVLGGPGAGICGARLGGRGQKSISRLFKVALKMEKIKRNFIEYRRAYHALLRVIHTAHLAFNSFSY